VTTPHHDGVVVVSVAAWGGRPCRLRSLMVVDLRDDATQAPPHVTNQGSC